MICSQLIKYALAEDGVICSECVKSPPLFTSLYSLSPYTPRVRALIHQMKYGKDSKVAKCLGSQLAIYVIRVAPFLIEENSVIIPVPLTFRKHFTRGFNQTDLMGKNLSRLTGIPFMPRALRRVAEFSPQAGRMAKERQLLTQEVFRINSLNTRAYKNIILLDDVATTLATLNACTKEIMNACGNGVSVYGFIASRSY
jgi:ComF family protein